MVHVAMLHHSPWDASYAYEYGILSPVETCCSSAGCQLGLLPTLCLRLLLLGSPIVSCLRFLLQPPFYFLRAAVPYDPTAENSIPTMLVAFDAARLGA